MKQVIATERVPIKLWLDDIEEGALAQAKNLANLLFAFKHISIMPDAHQGYGMPIGGVLATKGVIIPNAVGVDIGCFSGDTKVPLLDGTQRTLKDMAEQGEDVWVYSLDATLKLVPGKATPKVTRKDARLVEVGISGGEVIRCTADHEFMLLDGTYKAAENLVGFDSLMPLYRSYQSRDGYERIRTTPRNGVLAHKMVAEHFMGIKGEDEIIHHKDGTWWNNEPDNLEYLDKRVHSRQHRIDKPVFGTEDFKAKRLETLQEAGFYAPEFAEKKKEVARQNLAEFNASDEKREMDKAAGKRGAQYLIAYNKSEKGRQKSAENGRRNRKVEKAEAENHKVLWVRESGVIEDVYCLTVPEHHNFALSAGVFVHNCGMCACKTPVEADSVTTDGLKQMMGLIRKTVPVGFASHKEAQDTGYMPAANDGHPIALGQYSKATTQIGTLGGGNHFIELQRGDDGFLWAMIHSGSRNLGYTVARHYNKLAIKMNRKWNTAVPEKWELAFFPIDSDEGKIYLNEMEYCVRFAEANRALMMSRVIEAMSKVVHIWPLNLDSTDVSHNYAAMENHFGENVMVHRKGATMAREEQLGIIPGSQGTHSYIVRGKGNPDSFQSCSHGAGRRMGRKQAKRELDLGAEIAAMGDVVHGIRTVQDLDEAPGAYKDIDVVMANQADLVDIEVELTPLAVVKA